MHHMFQLNRPATNPSKDADTRGHADLGQGAVRADGVSQSHGSTADHPRHRRAETAFNTSVSSVDRTRRSLGNPQSSECTDNLMGIGYQFDQEFDDLGILKAASTDSETSSCEHRGRYPCVLFESATETTAEDTAREEAGDALVSESTTMRAWLARTDDRPLGWPTHSVLIEKKI